MDEYDEYDAQADDLADVIADWLKDDEEYQRLRAIEARLTEHDHPATLASVRARLKDIEADAEYNAADDAAFRSNPDKYYGVSPSDFI